jgi:tetratricopeptide (TPR) repeat protein
MIARNAAELVAASLDSVRNIADEIIVVDTGSTDRTRDVALQRASRLVDFAWCDDFAAARNACLEQATGDWVFWLDAGETLSSDAANRLRGFVDAQTDNNRAFLVMVQTPPAGDQIAAEQVARLRLHPRRTGIEFTGRIREELQTAIEAAGMSIELAPIELQRSKRDHDTLVKQQRAERNVHLAALEIKDHGPLASPLLAMADACVALGHVVQGIEFYSRALELAARGSTAMLEAFYGVLAALDHLPEAREKQIALCSQALEVYPFDAQLLCAMGSYLQLQGRLDLACRSFEAAAQFGQIDPQTWHLTEIGEVATVCYATCQDLLSDTAAARRTLETAIAAKPASQRLRRQLLELHIRHDNRKEALELVGQLPADTPHREALRSAVRGACLAAKQNWIPALAYLQTAFGSGCRDVICLRGLVTTYLASGDLAAAERTVRDWEAAHPGSSEIARFAAEVRRQQQTAPAPSGPTIRAGDRNLRLDTQPHKPAPLGRHAAEVVQPSDVDALR